jgi:hypothetical protein
MAIVPHSTARCTEIDESRYARRSSPIMIIRSAGRIRLFLTWGRQDGISRHGPRFAHSAEGSSDAPSRREGALACRHPGVAFAPSMVASVMAPLRAIAHHRRLSQRQGNTT